MLMLVPGVGVVKIDCCVRVSHSLAGERVDGRQMRQQPVCASCRTTSFASSPHLTVLSREAVANCSGCVGSHAIASTVSVCPRNSALDRSIEARSGCHTLTALSLPPVARRRPSQDQARHRTAR